MIIPKQKTLTLMILGLWCIFLPAQKRGLRFETYTSEDGMSQNTIQTMLQDERGFLWIGTTDGLNRYDGDSFTIFRSSDQTGLDSSDINALYEGRDGRLWIGTHGGGASVWEKGVISKVDLPHKDGQDLMIRDFIEDKQGNLWIATQGQGLLCMTDGEVRAYQDSPDPNRGNSFWRLTLDKNGELWVGAANSFIYHYDAEDDLLDGYYLGESGIIYDLLFDRSGHLWICSGNGLKRFHDFNHLSPGQPENYIADPNDPHSIPSSRIWDVFQDSYGKIWVGTQKGLSLYNPEKNNFENYISSSGDKKSLSHSRVLAMMEDRSGSMWVGTVQGLNKFNRRSRFIANYHNDPNDPESVEINFAKAILEDSRDRLWLGGYGTGLSLLDPDRRLIKHFDTGPDDTSALPGGVVFALLEDSKQQIWVGADTGIARYEEESGVFRHREPEGMGTGQITHIIEKSDRIWVTCDSGVASLHPELNQWQWYLPRQDWNENLPLTIYGDSRGHFYIGTIVGGAYRLDPQTGTYEQFRHDTQNRQSISDNRVTCFLEQGERLWVATHGGLNLMDRDTGVFRHWKITEGLPNNVIYAILPDELGRLWLSTNVGLSRFDPLTETFRNYGIHDGLQDWEFNRHSYFKSRGGELFFGGVRGVNAFYPQDLEDNGYVPPVAFTRVAVLDHIRDDMDPSQVREIVLEPHENVVSFGFAALDYNVPRANRYACKMDGFHDGWVNLGNRRQYTFTNLDPGSYSFNVKAASSDGVWNQQGRSLRVVVLPDWYETIWFKVFLGLALVIFPMMVQWYRLRLAHRHNLDLRSEITRRHKAEERIKTLNNRLEERVRERTAQLEAAQKEMLENAHRAGMSEIASSVLHNVGNVLNSLITSSEMIREQIDKLPIRNLDKANFKLRQILENADALDQQSEMLLDFYQRIDAMMSRSKEELEENVGRILNKVSIIREVVIAQQGYATLGAAPEIVRLDQVVEDALKIQEASLERHHIQIVKNYLQRPSIRFHKARLIHIFINIIKNAREAMEMNPREQSELLIQLDCDRSHALLTFTDNGVGVEPEHIEHLFRHGFTTKDHGHGFGLNSCASAMKEMNGRIWVDSEGSGKGARFSLQFNLVESPALRS